MIANLCFYFLRLNFFFGFLDGIGAHVDQQLFESPPPVGWPLPKKTCKWFYLLNENTLATIFDED